MSIQFIRWIFVMRRWYLANSASARGKALRRVIPLLGHRPGRLLALLRSWVGPERGLPLLDLITLGIRNRSSRHGERAGEGLRS